MPTTIKNVRTIITAPEGIDLVVVKVETSDAGLYGLGCATYTQRPLAVREAIDQYLCPLVKGRDVDCIEDIFRLSMVNGYWRNGPVINNAVSGIDMALWDIKGKRAGMPVYQLLGGKCREAAAVYRHARGETMEEVEEAVQQFMSEGVRYIRAQHGVYGGMESKVPRPDGAKPGAYYDPAQYIRSAIRMFEFLRERLGFEIELLHDVHERLYASDALRLAKALEPYRLFFLEDPLAPEDLDHLRTIKNQCATPIALGELFNNPREWQLVVRDNLVDFIRMHISQMGGLTPARKVAAMAEIQGIRTAWHGPNDTSPIGHACNLHLDLCCPNFGIQEWPPIVDAAYEVFPGCPEVRNGYLYPNDKPGFGVDIDENKAAKYVGDGAGAMHADSPNHMTPIGWTQARLPDGSMSRP